MFSKRRVLRPPRAGLGVAVHRIADPQHLLAGLAHGFDHRRQRLLDVLRAEAVDEGETSRLFCGFSVVTRPCSQSVHRRADLHADRVGDAAEVFHVRAIELRRAHADPRHVRRQVVPALLARDEARLRLLVRQVQAFVAGEEVDRGDFVRRAAAAHALEEVERVGDGIGDPLVLRP